MTREYWAKPDQTYNDHINAAYRAWKETVEGKKRLIQRTGEICGFDPDRFHESSLLTVALHDLGKNTLEFQRMMQVVKAGRRPNPQDNYRHEIVSYSFALYAGKGLEEHEGTLLPIPFPIEAFTILGHHKSINPEMAAFSREQTACPPTICHEGMKDAIALASEIFSEEGYTLPRFQWPIENPIKSVMGLIGPCGVFPKLYENFPIWIRCALLMHFSKVFSIIRIGTGLQVLLSIMHFEPRYLISSGESRVDVIHKGSHFPG